MARLSQPPPTISYKSSLTSDLPVKSFSYHQTPTPTPNILLLEEGDDERIDPGGLLYVKQVLYVMPACVLGLKLQKSFSLKLKYKFSQVINRRERIK